MMEHILEMARGSDIFSDEKPDAKVREVKTWLSNKGVRDLEPVSIFCDQLDKVRVLVPAFLHFLLSFYRKLSHKSYNLKMTS